MRKRMLIPPLVSLGVLIVGFASGIDYTQRYDGTGIFVLFALAILGAGYMLIAAEDNIDGGMR